MTSTCEANAQPLYPEKNPTLYNFSSVPWFPYHILLLLRIERLLDHDQNLGHKFPQQTQNNRTKPLVYVLCPNLLRDSSDDTITAQLTKVTKRSTGSMVVWGLRVKSNQRILILRGIPFFVCFAGMFRKWIKETCLRKNMEWNESY